MTLSLDILKMERYMQKYYLDYLRSIKLLLKSYLNQNLTKIIILVRWGLSILEDESREFESPLGDIDIGIISVGCLMQSIKIRHANSIFNRERKNLDSWADELFLRESMEKTKPPIT